MGLAIQVDGVSKSFRRYRADRPYMLQEVLARGMRGLRAAEQFWALRDVSFSVARGRAVGIIGSNGSGKSTLLRLVGGIGRPDSGRIAIAGRVGALLDLGSGLHPDLTGRENVIVAGVLSGLSRREVLRRFDDIVAFSELSTFIDNPLRTYSSGMQMRLAFAINVHTNPDVLLIDEVLAVGDASFQRRCLVRIREFKAAGCSILLVSHGLAVVQSLCDEVIWMNSGHLMAHGRVVDVVPQYEAHVGYSMEPPRLDGLDTLPGAHPSEQASPSAAIIADTPTLRLPAVLVEESHGAATGSLRVMGVTLLDDAGHPVNAIRAGHGVRVAIGFVSVGRAAAPRFRVRFVRQDGLVCCDFGTSHVDSPAPAVHADGRMTLVLDRLDLNAGHYSVDVTPYGDGLSPGVEATAPGCPLVVIGSGTREAVLDVPHRWELAVGISPEAPVHGGQ